MKKYKKFENHNRSEGIALLLTIIILSIVMLVAIIIVAIVSVQFKLASDINDSIVAIYTADSGIEWQLYQIRKGVSVTMPAMSNGAMLTVTVTGSSPNFTIKSLGSYRNVKRQLEVSF